MEFQHHNMLQELPRGMNAARIYDAQQNSLGVNEKS